MKLMKSKKDMKFLRNPQKLQRHNKMQHKEKKEEFSMFFKKRKTPSTKCLIKKNIVRYRIVETAQWQPH
jgi:hypothetical protein